MNRLKYVLIRIADWLDDRVLNHPSYWLCQKIGLSDWWGND